MLKGIRMSIITEELIASFLGSFTAGLGVTASIWFLVYLRKFIQELRYRKIIDVFSKLLPEFAVGKLECPLLQVQLLVELSKLKKWKEVEKVLVYYIHLNYNRPRLKAVLDEKIITKWNEKYDALW